MKLVVKNGFLIYKNQKFKCSIGKNGLSASKIEGDGCTPLGSFSIIKIFYRADKIGIKKFFLDTQIIKPFDGWCDDIRSDFYNSKIKFPFSYSAEKLYREDDLYDIVCVIDYNINPIIKNKGSAIFLHVASEDYQPTQGCVALSKSDLLKIVIDMRNNPKIEILN
tara:strand:- start:849 stop:1343 length:495 start_codon:yes stop_codon:yes gene_type:complete